MKIKAIPRYYFGYLQGFKVWLDGVKYPRKRGYFYTAMKQEAAIKDAQNDARGGK